MADLYVEPNGDTGGVTGPGSNGRTPRWVNLFGVIATVLAVFVLFVIVAGVGGPHGSGRHASSDAVGHTRWDLSILLAILAAGAVALNWNWLVPVPRNNRVRPVRQWAWWATATKAWPTTIMTSRLRKFALTAHVTSAVGSLGAVAAFLALALAGLTSPDAQVVRAAYVAMELTARFVIVPLILVSLLAGIVQSLGTNWGLFQHYWVVVKLLLTVLATIVVLQQMGTISYVAGVAAETTLSRADLRAARISLVVHAAGGLLVLLLAATLSVYKPRGMTRHGWRRQHEPHGLSQP